MTTDYQYYGFRSAKPSHMHRWFMPLVFELAVPLPPGLRVLDIGCGNGYTAGMFLERGCEVVGIDLSESGVELARKSYPQGRFEVLAADDGILENLNERPFDLIVSTEVVEHVYDPRAYVKGAFRALKPGGRFICTTPYHGYGKNLLISLFNKWDSHANPLWDGGHIKLWSRATLSALLAEPGFVNFRFRGAGRLPWLWMTMVVSVEKPLES